MKEQKKKGLLEKKSTPKVVIIVCLLICIVMGFLSYGYYQQLQSTVKNESGGYLQEISRQMGNNVSRAINDNFSVLGTVATVLRSSGVKTYSEFQPIASAQRDDWNYQDIMLIDKGGNAYGAYGNTVQLGTAEYLRTALVEEKSVMAASQMVNGIECIVFAIPLKDVTVDGKEMGALVATYDQKTFDQVLSMTAFGGKGYAHILRRDGAVVVRSSSENAAHTGYNLLNTFENAQIDEGYTLDQVRTDITGGLPGIITYTFDGTHKYMAYTPLDTQGWYLATFVPVDVVNAKSEILMNMTLLACGVITAAFAVLFVILLMVFSRHRARLERIAYVDPVTRGNTAQRFTELAENLLKKAGDKQYALIYTNIQKFKILNEQYGHTACDEMMQAAYDAISADLTSDECLGRWYADHICMLVQCTDQKALLERFEQWYAAAITQQENRGQLELSPVVEFGVYIVKDNEMKIITMVDSAKMSMRDEMKELNDKLKYSIYDDADRLSLIREKHLEDIMEAALKNNEFRAYLQPKYRTQSETIGGAEALVRWESEEDGMIYPNEFIPIFEKNGFIVKLDLWMFEQTCRTLASWIKAGREPVKISVNCSRMHLKRENFLDRYREICAQYGVPPKYIEIEITENVVFEDVETLTHIIDEIHAAGFGCSMDDFGSGYSSLNLIQDIPVDTLKLDKAFFHGTSKRAARAESVIASVLAMARSLKMETVAEGIETREQVDMLKKLGCDYIQGYYFAKPMPIADFERLFFGGEIGKREGDA